MSSGGLITGAGVGLRHEALLYADDQQFADATIGFIGDGLAAGEPVHVLVSAAKIDLLRAAFGDGDGLLTFANIVELGHNPARIIPAWQAFLDEHGREGRPVRGIGEPIWPARRGPELVECQRHEALLNVAFSWPLWLLCPYDASALTTEVLEEAERSHPFLWCKGRHEDSPSYSDPLSGPGVFGGELPEPSAVAGTLRFDLGSLPALRRFVGRTAVDAGMDEDRARELVFAANEIATNSLLHGGGQGTARVWREDGVVVVEVTDGGHIDHPLVGRQRPDTLTDHGRGMWLVNQLCDLVQIASTPSGTAVRVRVSCS